MRIVILGAGGIGSIVAAYFGRAGHDVTLIARGEHLRATRERGIRVTGLADFTTPVTVAESADGACDAFILATKTPDTRSALAAVAGLRPALSLSLQNGVAKDRVLAETFVPVAGATTMVGATRTGPGEVAYTLDGATYVGDEATELAEAWNATGLQMTVVENILGHEWAKQALQGPAATLAVASDLPNHLVHLRLARPFALALREVAAVANAGGVELAAGEDYGFDVRAMASEPLDAAVARVVRRGEQLVAAGKTDIVVSMLQDVRAGRPTEIEETAGFVVAEADRLGVDVPNLRLLCDLVRARSAAA
jgi:2-dehydropantoate 2-reductase